MNEKQRCSQETKKKRRMKTVTEVKTKKLPAFHNYPQVTVYNYHKHQTFNKEMLQNEKKKFFSECSQHMALCQFRLIKQIQNDTK